MNTILRATHFQGVSPESLGGYLTGLGILSACSTKWPGISGCWREGHFILLHSDFDSTSSTRIQDFLIGEWDSPVYPTDSGKPFWAEKQKSDTKKRTSKGVQFLRSTCALKDVEFLDSHLVSATKNVFNPVFGTGGNVGKRNLAKVAEDALTLIDNADDSKSWLDHTLFGTEATLPELPSSGTWFVIANKTYNSGQDGFYREGRLSPWSFLLALEGALLLKGGIGRRLSAKARPYAAFPFVAEAADPYNENAVGLKRAGEFWAPIWEVPCTIIELRALLRRGLARLDHRAATSPHEFGAAALTEGLDAGIDILMPFELRETTSSQTYEAIPRRAVKIRKDERGHHAAKLITEILPWIRRLPYETKDAKNRGKFAGLRGSVEQAILSVTEEPDDPVCWQSLILELARTQMRIDQDRTRDWRIRCVAIPRLSLKWLDFLWPKGRPREVEVACAIASIGARGIQPLLVNIFGVEVNSNGYAYFPKNRPLRAVWHEGTLSNLLIDIIRRRLVDVQTEDVWPLDATYFAPAHMVADFLDGTLDDEVIARWLPALSMLDWRQASGQTMALCHESADGMQLLDAFFRPLLTSGMRWAGMEIVPPHASAALRLVHLLQQDDLESAVDFACARINALGRAVVARPIHTQSCGQRVAAGLLIPIERREVFTGRERWLLQIQREE